MQRQQKSTFASRAALAATTAVLVGILVASAHLPGASARSSVGLVTKPSPSRAIFERRILPLLRASNPSTCSECHLSGVDLKDYIRPTEAQTFAALRDRGMLDVQRPDQSRILKFIRMSRPKTPLVTQKVRTAEYTAFHDWIVAAVKDPKLADAPAVTAKSIGPVVPNVVIRHTRIDSVVASFTQNVWSQQGRCMNCHQAGTQDNNDKVKQFGERVAWFKPDSAEATMQALIKQGDVDIEHPDQSLILLKPLGKVPHGGGVKMTYGDAGYKMFRAWVEDYAASVKGRYRTARDLPAPPKDALVEMNCVLAVTDGLDAWQNKSLRVDVFPWDKAKGAWSGQPAASGERLVYAVSNGQPNSTNLIMYLITPTGGTSGEEDRLLSRLGQGRYLLRYYCDTAGAMDKDYALPTNSPAFFQGEQQVNAVWNKKAGWGALVKVRIGLNATPPSSTFPE